MQITSWRKIRFAGWNLSLSSSLSLYKNAKTRYEDNSRILALFKISSAFQKYILIFMVLCPCIFINILNSWLKSSEENRGVCRSLVTQFCHPVRSHLSDEVCTWVALGKDYMELNISVWLFHIWSHKKCAAPDCHRATLPRPTELSAHLVTIQQARQASTLQEHSRLSSDDLSSSLVAGMQLVGCCRIDWILWKSRLPLSSSPTTGNLLASRRWLEIL